MVQILEPAFDVVQRIVFGFHLGVARRLIPEAAATNALGERKTRNQPPLDQPTPFVSLFVAQFHHARTHGIEFFLYIAFEEIEGLMEMSVRIDDLHGMAPEACLILAIIGRFFLCQGKALDTLRYSEFRNATNWFFSASESALNLFVTSAACPA